MLREIKNIEQRETIIKLEALEDLIKTLEEIQKQMERAKNASNPYIIWGFNLELNNWNV